MDRNIISLEHLYNPAKLGVGKLYDDVFEGFEHSYWFALENQKLIKFFNSCKIEDCIFLLTKSYKIKYPSTRITDIYGYLTESKKEGINKRRDLDIDWFPNRRLEIIEVKFLKNVNLQLLKTAIEEALNGKQFQLSGNVYTVIDSPIDTITFSENSFTLKCHQNKVIKY
jgi:hypothetical protein